MSSRRLDGLAVVAVVVFLFPAVRGGRECRAVFGPHLVDEGVPGLALPSPVLVVVFAGRFVDGFHELGVILAHPAVDVVEKGIVVPGWFRVHQPQRQSLGDPADARAAASIGVACSAVAGPNRTIHSRQSV